MTEPHSVHSAFQQAVARWPDHPFLQILPETADKYGIDPGEITYAQAASRVDALAASYRAAGYGAGHRVALLLENRPTFFMHWFALNAVGVSVVPINPDLRSTELEYLIAHSEVVLTIGIPARQDDLRRAAAASGRAVPVIGPDEANRRPRHFPAARQTTTLRRNAPCSIPPARLGCRRDAWCRRRGSCAAEPGISAWADYARCGSARKEC